METTDWDSYGTGRYEKCANCMAHCGYEPTAADATMRRPWSAAWTALRGVRTDGPMAPEIALTQPAPGAVRLHPPCRRHAGADPQQRRQQGAQVDDAGRVMARRRAPPGDRAVAPTAPVATGGGQRSPTFCLRTRAGW